MIQHEFDKYAANYDEILANAIPNHLQEIAYFAEYKIALTSRLMGINLATKILDFGCGSGRSFSFLKKYFPYSEIFGYDPSTFSLEVAKEQTLDVQIITDAGQIPNHHFDVIIASNVFHHISTEEQPLALKQCKDALKKNGSLFIFEHNPLNPLTRWVFNHCALDADAQMISMTNMKRLVSEASLDVNAQGYSLFFPKQLALFRQFESILKSIPFGAQYYLQLKHPRIF